MVELSFILTYESFRDIPITYMHTYEGKFIGIGYIILTFYNGL